MIIKYLFTYCIALSLAMKASKLTICIHQAYMGLM